MFQRMFVLFFKGSRRSIGFVQHYMDTIACKILFLGQNVRCKSYFTQGLPYISIANGGKCNIGLNFKMNNSLSSNPIGRPQKCILFVDKGGELLIGDNVGISQVAIVCYLSIVIGNDVKIGGGCCIYDTDFHSLNATFRRNPILDMGNRKMLPVTIKNNAFIGAHSTILKGVIIGENAIVGACSVVTKNIPDNEIWGGNPAKFIKAISNQDKPS